MRLATIVGSIALTLTFPTTASATQYRVTVDGDFTQLDGSIIAFGLEDRVIPFHAGFTLDTDSVPTTTLPAGTPISTLAHFQLTYSL